MTTVLRTTVLVGALALAAACATKPPPPPAATNQPPPPAGPPPSNPPPPVAQRPVGPVPGSVEDFMVSAGDRVYFETDSYTLAPDAQAILDRQAAWLARYPQVTIRIEGNCDERGTREYNLALGSRRAEAVRAYLAGRGVSAARISTISYGKERPIDGASTEEAWAKNRNGHTTLVSGARG
jgi:peptidoglycan-associated lipoprotein